MALCPYSQPRFHSLTQVLCETQLLKGRKLLFLDLTFPIPVPMEGRKAQVKITEEYTSQSRVSIPRTVHRCPRLNKRSQEGRQKRSWKGTLNLAWLLQTKENPEGSDNMPQINSQDPGIEESWMPHPTFCPHFWVEWEDSKIPGQSWLVCVRKDNLKDDGDSEQTWRRWRWEKSEGQ